MLDDHVASIQALTNAQHQSVHVDFLHGNLFATCRGNSRHVSRLKDTRQMDGEGL